MDERDIFTFSLSPTDRDKATIVISTLIMAALLVPPYLAVYYRWLRDGIKYPDANLLFSSDIKDEKQVRGHLRFLVAEKARHKLDILSPRLNGSVFNQGMADVLQQALTKRPNLMVRVLTGPEIEGFEGSKHPFYSSSHLNRNQVKQAIYNEGFPFAGIQADDYLLMQTSFPGGELVPSVP